MLIFSDLHFIHRLNVIKCAVLKKKLLKEAQVLVVLHRQLNYVVCATCEFDYLILKKLLWKGAVIAQRC